MFGGPVIGLSELRQWPVNPGAKRAYSSTMDASRASGLREISIDRWCASSTETVGTPAKA